MKVPKPSFILHSLVSNGPLPLLTAEETEHTLKRTEDIGSKYVTGIHAQSSTCAQFSILSHEQQKHEVDYQNDTQLCCGSPCFKVPESRPCTDCTRSRKANQMTPMVLSKLVNLSFTKCVSPRTPCVVQASQHHGLATTPTPASWMNGFGHRQGDPTTLNTPCVMDALHELQRAQDVGLPDMLTLIEDDMAGISKVEQQLLRNTEVELTDSNVVDYLLYVAQDEPVASYTNHFEDHCQERRFQPASPNTSHVSVFNVSSEGTGCNFVVGADPTELKAEEVQFAGSSGGPVGLAEEESELNVRRKRRRRSQKRMSAEEARAIRAVRTRLSASGTPTSTPSSPLSSLGLRLSKRIRRQPTRLQVHW